MDVSQNFLRRLRTDLRFYGECVHPEYFVDPSPEIHGKVYDAMDDQSLQLVNIQLPRGLAKTTIVSNLYPEREALLNVDPGQKIYGAISERIYGTPDLTGDIDREDVLTTKNGCKFIARGMNQSLLGLKDGHQRPNLVMADDCESLKNAGTLAQTLKNRRWIDQTLMPALDVKWFRYLNLATPASESCLCRIWGKDQDWFNIKARMRADDGTMLWPERFSEEWFVRNRAKADRNGTLAEFLISYQLEIVDRNRAYFKNFRYFDAWRLTEQGNAIVYADGKWRPVVVVAGLDTANSLADGADFTVLQPLGVDEDGFEYVFPCTRGRFLQTEIRRHVFDAGKRFGGLKEGGFRFVGVDAISAQRWISQMIRDAREEEGQYFAVKSFKHYDASKAERIATMGHPYEQGTIIHMRDKCKELERELLNHPRSDHDDCMDALWLAHQMALKVKRTSFNRGLSEVGPEPGMTKDDVLYDWRHL